MKIKSSSTMIFYGRKGGGLSGSTSSRGGSRASARGQASYGASGFGSGGSAKAGKSRKSPTPAPPRRRR